jgi:hypothetical protein
VWLWPASGTAAAVRSIHCMCVGLSILSMCSLAVHSSTHSSAHDRRARSTGDGQERGSIPFGATCTHAYGYISCMHYKTLPCAAGGLLHTMHMAVLFSCFSTSILTGLLPADCSPVLCTVYTVRLHGRIGRLHGV